MSMDSLWTRLRHALGGYPATAAEWAVRVQSEDVSRQELLVLDAWLKADPRHAEDYARVNKVAHLGLQLREDATALSALQGYQRLRATETRARNKPAMPGLRWVGAAAAVCVLVAGAAWLWFSPTSSGERYISSHGEQRQITLADGSRLVVNTDSEVRVSYDEKNRRVELAHGQAFFEVASVPARPFVVRTGDIEVLALGTQFSVRSTDTETEVVVTQGRVRVSRRDGAAPSFVDLAPDQRIRVKAAAAHPPVETVDARRATAWSTGTVIFEDEPLEQVVAEVNRYTRLPFVIADPGLNALRLTGRFRVGDMESVQFALKDRFGIVGVRSGQQIRLEGP